MYVCMYASSSFWMTRIIILNHEGLPERERERDVYMHVCIDQGTIY